MPHNKKRSVVAAVDRSAKRTLIGLETRTRSCQRPPWGAHLPTCPYLRGEAKVMPAEDAPPKTEVTDPAQ